MLARTPMLTLTRNSRYFLSGFFLLALIAACEETTVDTTVEPRTVRFMEIENSSGGVQQRFSGRLHSTSEVSFSFKVSGTLNALPVKTGEKVSAGDIIAELNSDDYELAAQQARAALSESQAASRNAKSNYERVKILYQEGNTSRNQLDDARANADSTSAAVESSRKALEIARNELKYTSLKADRDCAIASVDKDVGENIANGEQVVFATCGDEFEVQLDIPESIISSMSTGMTVAVRFPALPNKKFSGVVNEVGVSSISGGTTFPVDVLITDADTELLKAGLSAEVTFVLQAGQGDTIVVPSFAVGEDQNGRFVFLVTSNATNGTTTVSRQSVVVGQIADDGIQIVDGLAAGSRVVTAGVSVLRDGMAVRVGP